MTALQVYGPFADAGFEDFVRGFFQPARQLRRAVAPIKVDVTEKDDAYVVKADLPGVRKEDIQVTIDANQVTISAEVKRESEQKDGERVVRSERYVGAVSRSFVLPDDVKRLVHPVFAHRLVIARSGGRAKTDARAVLKELLEQVPVPA